MITWSILAGKNIWEEGKDSDENMQYDRRKNPPQVLLHNLCIVDFLLLMCNVTIMSWCCYWTKEILSIKILQNGLDLNIYIMWLGLRILTYSHCSTYFLFHMDYKISYEMLHIIVVAMLTRAGANGPAGQVLAWPLFTRRTPSFIVNAWGWHLQRNCSN